MSTIQFDGQSANFLELTSGTFIDLTSDWTLTMYLSLPNSSYGTRAFCAFPTALNTPTNPHYSDPYVFFGTTVPTPRWPKYGFGPYMDSLNDAAVEVYSTAAFVSPGAPAHAAVRYTAATRRFELLIDGAVVRSMINDMSSVGAVLAIFVGNDNFEVSQGHTIGRFRAWQARLTDAQVTAEAASHNAVHAINLLWDYTMDGASDLVDASGHQADLTLNGSVGTSIDTVP